MWKSNRNREICCILRSFLEPNSDLLRASHVGKVPGSQFRTLTKCIWQTSTLQQRYLIFYTTYNYITTTTVFVLKRTRLSHLNRWKRIRIRKVIVVLANRVREVKITLTIAIFKSTNRQNRRITIRNRFSTAKRFLHQPGSDLFQGCINHRSRTTGNSPERFDNTHSIPSLPNWTELNRSDSSTTKQSHRSHSKR